MAKGKRQQFATKADFEDLAEMTAQGFVDVEKRLTDNIGTGFQLMKESFEIVFEELKGIRDEVKISRQATRIEYMELSGRVDMLEKDMKKVKQKVKV